MIVVTISIHGGVVAISRVKIMSAHLAEQRAVGMKVSIGSHFSGSKLVVVLVANITSHPNTPYFNLKCFDSTQLAVSSAILYS